MASPPPYSKYLSVAVTFLLAVVTIFAIFIFSAAAPESRAADPSIVKRGDIYVNAPAQDIVLDSDAFANAFELQTTQPSVFKYESNWNGCANALTMSLPSSPTPSSPRTFTNPFSVKWKNVGFDKQGERIDILMKCNTLKAYYFQRRGDYLSPLKTHVLLTKDSTITFQPWWNWYVSMDVSFYIYKTGTNTPASGNFVMGVVDVDMPAYKTDGSGGTDYSHEFAEHFELISGYNTPYYITQNNFLNISSDGKKIMPTKSDTATYDSGFIISLNTSGARFKWAGCHTAGTEILKMLSPHNIVATAGSGGNITNNGTTVVGWKGEPIYTATASSNYRISSITVDGQAVSIPPNSKTYSYKFAPVVSDHTIDVRFSPIKVNLTYDKNLPSATGTTPSVSNANAGTHIEISENGFFAESYKFLGWNTKSDGSGTAYSAGSEYILGESDAVLYAQWVPIEFKITWIDTITGESFHVDSVSYGGTCKLPELPEHEGFSPLLPDFGTDNEILSNITEDKTFSIEYKKNTYNVSIEYINKGSRREISSPMNFATSYGDSFSINTHLSNEYIFLPELIEIYDSDTHIRIDNNLVYDDGILHCTNMPSRNLLIVLVYDTWIQMPATGSEQLPLLLTIGFIASTASLALIVRRTASPRAVRSK